MEPAMRCRTARILCMVMLCSSILLLAGCWDRAELNDLVLILAAGIDKKTDSTIELSVQVFVPKSADGGQGMVGVGGEGSSFVRSAVGKSIADAMAKLQEKFPRRIFWGHTEVYIIGRKLAEDDIRGSVDFMIRHPQVREGAYIFVSKDNAKEMLELMPPLERSSSEVLREMANSKTLLSVTLKDLIIDIGGDDQAFALPWIEKLPEEAGKAAHQTIPYISGTAIFKKGKLVNHINDKLTRGVQWIRNELDSAVATVHPEDTEGVVSMKLLRAQTELIPKIEDGIWKITVKGETEDDIIQNGTNLDLMNPEFTDMLEKYLRAAIDERIHLVLDEVQKKTKADIFGFANAFHRKYPKEFAEVKDRWDEILPEIEVSTEIEAHVRRPGMSSVPSGIPANEVKRK
jgi:spore germination protein KC